MYMYTTQKLWEQFENSVSETETLKLKPDRPERGPVSRNIQSLQKDLNSLITLPPTVFSVLKIHFRCRNFCKLSREARGDVPYRLPVQMGRPSHRPSALYEPGHHGGDSPHPGSGNTQT